MHVGSDGDDDRYARREFTRLSHQSSNAALPGVMGQRQAQEYRRVVESDTKWFVRQGKMFGRRWA